MSSLPGGRDHLDRLARAIDDDNNADAVTNPGNANGFGPGLSDSAALRASAAGRIMGDLDRLAVGAQVALAGLDCPRDLPNRRAPFLLAGCRIEREHRAASVVADMDDDPALGLQRRHRRAAEQL